MFRMQSSLQIASCSMRNMACFQSDFRSRSAGCLNSAGTHTAVQQSHKRSLLKILCSLKTSSGCRQHFGDRKQIHELSKQNDELMSSY